MNTNFYLKQYLFSQFDLIAGAILTHLSKGSTRYPNAKQNTIDVKAGIVY